VAGVNYAGGAVETTTAQFYAIASNLAEGVIEKLKLGDHESLGVNGWAVYDEAAGSPASGPQAWPPAPRPPRPASCPGDIITSMNGLPVGTDGTFKDYCDVIRTAASKPIATEVLRWDTEEVLRGELNGDQRLELAFSFAQEIEDEVGAGGGTYSEYVAITDDTGTLTVEVPRRVVVDRHRPAGRRAGHDGPVHRRRPRPRRLPRHLEHAGPAVRRPPRPAPATVADYLTSYEASADCTDGGIFDYDDGAFAGQYQLWEGCGGPRRRTWCSPPTRRRRRLHLPHHRPGGDVGRPRGPRPHLRHLQRHRRLIQASGHPDHDRRGGAAEPSHPSGARRPDGQRAGHAGRGPWVVSARPQWTSGTRDQRWRTW
jgi:serine protease Do